LLEVVTNSEEELDRQSRILRHYLARAPSSQRIFALTAPVSDVETER